ncbi:hypothetical protein FACS189483_11400 [Spirochaetia bacterium]|nr:hypothetical protein FACS189483_11400 [Spirochaetia bacterium]
MNNFDEAKENAANSRRVVMGIRSDSTPFDGEHAGHKNDNVFLQKARMKMLGNSWYCGPCDRLLEEYEIAGNDAGNPICPVCGKALLLALEADEAFKEIEEWDKTHSR